MSIVCSPNYRRPVLGLDRLSWIINIVGETYRSFRFYIALYLNRGFEPKSSFASMICKSL